MISHADYNAFVQRVQDEASSWGMEHRIEDRRVDVGTSKEGGQALFEVYFDGRWHLLGYETPFVKDRDAWIDEEEWILIQARAAKALVGS